MRIPESHALLRRGFGTSVPFIHNGLTAARLRVIHNGLTAARLRVIHNGLTAARLRVIHNGLTAARLRVIHNGLTAARLRVIHNGLTAARLSNFANNWLSISTNSRAVQPPERRVKPTISANRMLCVCVCVCGIMYTYDLSTKSMTTYSKKWPGSNNNLIPSSSISLTPPSPLLSPGYLTLSSVSHPPLPSLPWLPDVIISLTPPLPFSPLAT